MRIDLQVWNRFLISARIKKVYLIQRSKYASDFPFVRAKISDIKPSLPFIPVE